MFTAFIAIADVNKTIEERFQPDHSLGLTLVGVRTSYLAVPFDGGLVF